MERRTSCRFCSSSQACARRLLSSWPRARYAWKNTPSRCWECTSDAMCIIWPADSGRTATTSRMGQCASAAAATAVAVATCACAQDVLDAKDNGMGDDDGANSAEDVSDSCFIRSHQAAAMPRGVPAARSPICNDMLRNRARARIWIVTMESRPKRRSGVSANTSDKGTQATSAVSSRT